MILYTQVLDDVIADLARTVERLAHIDPSRVLSIGASRSAHGKWGGLAECIALDIAHEPTFEFTYTPRPRALVSATPWFIPANRRVVIDGLRMLYLLRFRFPRFLDQAPLHSVIHELLHISERFDGTHRSMRHGVWFDRYVNDIELEWRRVGDPQLVPIMDLDFEGLRKRFGAVACRCFRKPFRAPLRLPFEKTGAWDQHPDVRKLKLKIPRKGPKPCRLKFDSPADVEVTEANLEYRVFHPSGSKPIPASLIGNHPDLE